MNTKDLARRWFEELWMRKDITAVERLMHPDAVGVTEGGESRGIVETRDRLVAPLLAAFSHFDIRLEQIIVEGNDAVVRWNIRATHTGPFGPLPPSGRRVEFSGMTWLRFGDGLVIEGWDRWNLNALIDLLATGRGSATVKLVQ